MPPGARPRLPPHPVTDDDDLLPSLPIAGDFTRIDVTCPRSHSSADVTFLVTTQTLAAGTAEFSVTRRFRDVIALANILADVYKGFFVPTLPAPAIAGADEEFLEWRRSEVEKYLRRLAAHPVIGKGEEVRVFLLSVGYLPARSRTVRVFNGALRIPRPAFGEVLRELKQVVVSEFGVDGEVMEDDEEFLERKEMILDFEYVLVRASVQAEALVKAQEDIGETMGELALALIKLTKFETDKAMFYSQVVYAADGQHVAATATETKGFYRDLNAETVKHLNTLHEYLELMLAVKSAFSERASALLSVQTLMSDLSSLQMKKDKLEAVYLKKFDRSTVQEVDEIRETIRLTEDAKNCALRDFEKIKENNSFELVRFDKERQEDFLSMLKGFAMNQVIYSEKIANAWVAVTEETIGYELE